MALQDITRDEMEEWGKLTAKIIAHFEKQPFSLLRGLFPPKNIEEARKLVEHIEKTDAIGIWAKENNQKDKFEAIYKDYEKRFQLTK